MKFNNKMTEFDIVIPLGPLDNNVINQQIPFTKKNIIGYRNIYIITCNKNYNFEGCITICEDIFPFSMETVQEFHGKRERNGWYLQQLLKLYAGKVNTNKTININTENWNSGIYYVIIKMENRNLTHRFVVE